MHNEPVDIPSHMHKHIGGVRKRVVGCERKGVKDWVVLNAIETLLGISTLNSVQMILGCFFEYHNDLNLAGWPELFQINVFLGTFWEGHAYI